MATQPNNAPGVGSNLPPTPTMQMQPYYIADPTGQQGMIPNPYYQHPTADPRGLSPGGSTPNRTDFAAPQTYTSPPPSGTGNQVSTDAPTPTGQQSGGGGGGSSSSSGAAPATTGPTGDLQFQPYMNPLAMSAFFSQQIQPYLKGLAQQFGDQSKQWQSEAQANLGRFQMPAQFKAFFGQAQPQMAQDASNVQAALMASAATQPQYQDMMTRLGSLQKQGQQAYAEQLARKAAETAGIATPAGAAGTSPTAQVAGM